MLVAVIAAAGVQQAWPRPEGDAAAVRALDGTAGEQLTAWLLANTGSGARIAAPPGVTSRLSSALPGRRVVDMSSADTADLAIRFPGSTDGQPTVAVARFTGARGVIEVGEPLRPGDTARSEQVRRRRAGERLVKSVNLRLTPRAWSALASGGVDRAIVTVLGEVCRRHTVEVSSFPRDAALLAAAPARVAAVTAVDGGSIGDAPRGALSTLRSARVGTRLEPGDDHGQRVVLVRVLVPEDR